MNSFRVLRITALLLGLVFSPSQRMSSGSSSAKAASLAGNRLSPMTIPSTGSYTGTARIQARLLLKDFKPDGDLSKKVWKHADWVRFDHDLSGRLSYPQAETRVAALWTQKFLYFAIRSRYTTLNLYEGDDPAREKMQLWDRDVAEIFLNPEPARMDHYYEFEVAPDNRWIDLEIDKRKTPIYDAAWNSGFEHATRIEAGKHVWMCELRIPVSSLGASAVPLNAEWRVNFFRADGPGDDEHRRFLAWSTIPEGKTFHVPARFGILRFTK